MLNASAAEGHEPDAVLQCCWLLAALSRLTPTCRFGAHAGPSLLRADPPLPRLYSASAEPLLDHHHYWTSTGPPLGFHLTSTGTLLGLSWTPYWTSTGPLLHSNWTPTGASLDLDWTLHPTVLRGF